MDSMSNYEQLDYWTFGFSALIQEEGPGIQKSKNPNDRKREKLITVQLYNYACIQLLTAQVTKVIKDEQSSPAEGERGNWKLP